MQKLAELILELLKLAENIDEFEKTDRENITETFEKEFSAGTGTVTVCVRYDNVPVKELNNSFNQVNECFGSFYQEFFEKISSDKISNQKTSDKIRQPGMFG